ncbi:DUF6286 domain-containing protein [Kitasatospora camelliae]|uniref:DUF6286 domain-containing protein n=1 Tax=Kitasatospora camelliae TaxID=3156397 RepID=A0AAU8K1C2_9ACTN
MSGKVHRPRSARTAVTGVVVTAVLVLAAAVLYDVIAVRTGHPARAWRAEVARELETRTLDDPWVLAGAGVALVAGVALCWLAFAPGLRRWLPLTEPGAAIDRAGVAALISTRIAAQPEPLMARVRVGRKRTRVSVTGTADPAALERELREELARVPLGLPHRLDVRTLTPKPSRKRRLAEEGPPR